MNAERIKAEIARTLSHLFAENNAAKPDVNFIRQLVATVEMEMADLAKVEAR